MEQLENIFLKKDKIQQEALAAWINSGKKSTLQVITGLGKTRIAIEAIKLLPISSKILFLAEQTDRKLELDNEQSKWGAMKYSIEFACYQSAYKWENTVWDLVICDEVDCALSPEYSKFFLNNTYKSIMGLTATIDKRVRVYPDSEDDFTTKLELLNTIAPICYTYTINEGQSEGTARKLNVYIINHKLDITNKNIKAGSKVKPFFQTEFGANANHEKIFKIALMGGNAGFIRMIVSRRATFLYNLPSKIIATKKLLSGLKGKSIVFGNSLDALNQVTENVISSKKTSKENNIIRTNFDKGNIKVIGSFKKLERGANLVALDNCILMSYFSQEKGMIQRIGRMRNNGLIGNVFIFVTFNTQEEKWYNKMFENMENLNIINCYSVEECLIKYNK